MEKTPKIAVVNQKGGCGKTSTAYNLAGALSIAGKKLLLIDLDPQGNLSKSFLYPESVTSKDIFSDTIPTPIPTNIENISILPADKTLSALVPYVSSDVEYQYKVKDYLEKISGYDLILIDTPPTIGGFSLSALIASNYFLIPISTQFYTIQGTNDLLDSLKKIQSRINPDLEMLGVCISIHDKRTVLACEILKETQTQFKEKCFKTVIGKSVKVEEAAVKSIPVVQSFPSSQTAKEYKSLAKEMMEILCLTNASPACVCSVRNSGQGAYVNG